MHPVTAILQSLGSGRAVANARRQAEQLAREDWLVEGLCRRLDRVRETGSAAGPASGTEAAAGQP